MVKKFHKICVKMRPQQKIKRIKKCKETTASLYYGSTSILYNMEVLIISKTALDLIEIILYDIK